MITFEYNEEMKVIKASLDNDSRHEGIYMSGGVYQSRKNCFLFPMNEENIDILYRKYQPQNTRNLPIVWKNSLREEILKRTQDKVKDTVNTNFLRSLTVENITQLPYLIKNNTDQQPFVNQHISQYWGSYIPHHALLWEMGTGKTRAAIDIFMIKKEQGDVETGLVLCPKSMVNKWVVEIEKWSDCKAMPFYGTKEDKLETLEEKWDWIVVTFESFERYREEFLAIVDEKRFVILDETTKIKNPKAKRAKACHDLGLKTKHKLILTGTPVTQHAYDVFSQFKFLDCGETFGFDYDSFINQYFWRRGYSLIARSGAIEEISKKMYGKSATRFLKKDCIDIPDKVYDSVLLDLPPETNVKYKEMVKWAITQLEGGQRVTASIILTQLLRLSQITSGFVKDVSGNELPFKENPKLDALEDIIENSNSNKIIVWGRFVHDIRAIKGLCDKMGVKAVTIFGEDGQAARTENVRQFQEEPDCKVIIGTAGSGGHGIDLTAASIVVYFSNSYSLEQRLQSEDRAHRAGQKNQVTYIDLLCKDTIDVAIYKVLRSKKNIADIVTQDNLRSFL